MEKQIKERTGLVVSNKMTKTVIVAVKTLKRHALYDKTIRRTVRYMADDPASKCQPGDVVRIVETRPLSHAKRWRVAEIIKKSEKV
jgi:small subunit ribosomal protein S17